MGDFLFLLAQGGNETAEAIAKGIQGQELSTGDIVAIIVGITGSLGSLVGVVRWIAGWLFKRVEEMRDDFKEQLKKKDDEIDKLSKALSKKSDEMSDQAERLRGETIAKMEGMTEKVVNLVERSIEQSAAVDNILRTLEIKITGHSGGSSDTGGI